MLVAPSSPDLLFLFDVLTNEEPVDTMVTIGCYHGYPSKLKVFPPQLKLGYIGLISITTR